MVDSSLTGRIECSYFVLMESRGSNRRFPPPWSFEKSGQEALIVKDANGLPLAIIHYWDDVQRYRFSHSHLSSDEAERLAKAITRIPEFMELRRGFHSRQGGKGWNSKRPYNVAVEDVYVRGHWDEIDTLCKFNGIPQHTIHGKLGDHGSAWVVFEFANQMDAILFWDEFKGRWLLGDDFVYPERPKDLPRMRRPPAWEKMTRKKRRD